MSSVPRAATPHPAFAAFVRAGTVPRDPGVLDALSEDERKAVEVHARLADPQAHSAALAAHKTRS